MGISDFLAECNDRTIFNLPFTFSNFYFGPLRSGYTGSATGMKISRFEHRKKMLLNSSGKIKAMAEHLFYE